MAVPVYQRFFLNSEPCHRHHLGQLILERLGDVCFNRHDDGGILKPTCISEFQTNYIIPRRWSHGGIITMDTCDAGCRWFWLDAEIPFNSELAQSMARLLIANPLVLLLAEDNTRGAFYESAEAWLVDQGHYLLSPGGQDGCSS